MFRCPRAALASPFRLWPSRFAVAPDVPPSSGPSFGIRRPGRRGAPSRIASRDRSGGGRPPHPAVFLAAALAFAACGAETPTFSSVAAGLPRVDPGPAEEGGRRPGAGESLTGLPSRSEAIGDMGAGALSCVAYFRAAERDWKAEEFKVDYSPEALEKADGKVASTEYNLWRAMTIGAEKLPSRLGVRAVCLLPYSETGLAEVVGAVETVLRGRGALGPGEGLPPDLIGVPSAAAETPPGALWRVLALLGPRPLVAQESPGEECVQEEDEPTYDPDCYVALPPIVGTGKCLPGFDRNEHTGQCEASAPPPPPPPLPPPPTGGSSGGTPTPTTPPPAPTLACGGGDRGSQIQCRVHADDGVSVTDATWSFSSHGSTDRNVSAASGDTIWGGFAAESGLVAADVTYARGETSKEVSLSAPVTVSDRGWTWPDVDNLGDAGAGLDGCYGGTDWGLTEGPDGCDAQFFDPSSAEIKQGTGPWGLGYYVRSVLDASKPSVRWGLAPVLRKGAGLRYPTSTLPADVRRNCGGLASVYDVNLVCSKNTGDDYDASKDFNGLIAAVIAHEALHVAAVETEAAKSENDLHAIWDGLVGSSGSEVATEALNRANAVLDALQQASLAVHGANPITQYNVWRYDGSAWRRKLTP